MLLAGLLSGLTILTGFAILTLLSGLATVLSGFTAVLSGLASVVSFSADGVTQADARFATVAAAALLRLAGAVLAEGFFGGGVGAAFFGGGAVGGGAGASGRVVFLFVFFNFLFALLLAFGILAIAVLFEFADFQLDFLAFDAEADGQFGCASFEFGGRAQDLIGVSVAQTAVDGTAGSLAFQAFTFAAFQFGFEVIAIGATRDTDDETIAFAVDLLIVGFASLGEGEFFTGFAFGFGRRRGRGRRRGSRSLGSRLRRGRAENAHLHFLVFEIVRIRMRRR